MAEPIRNLDKQVTQVQEEMTQIRKPLAGIESPIISLDKKLTGLSGDIAGLRDLLSMVLTSIFIAAALIAIGTPIMAILIWRHKNKFLPSPKPGENSEDDLTRENSRTPLTTRR